MKYLFAIGLLLLLLGCTTQQLPQTESGNKQLPLAEEKPLEKSAPQPEPEIEINQQNTAEPLPQEQQANTVPLPEPLKTIPQTTSGETDGFDLSKYPYTIPKISDGKKTQLINEFVSRGICAQDSKVAGEIIDQYGYINDARCSPIIHAENKQPTPDDEYIKKAKEIILKNPDFFGIERESDLPIFEVESNTDFVNVRGGQQQYNKFNIRDTRLQIEFYRDGSATRIIGHYWKGIKFPTKPQIQYEDAVKLYLGKKVEYIDKSGKESSFIIKSDDFLPKEKSMLGVYPYETSKGIEFRLVWRLGIGQPVVEYVYIDAINGEELEVIKLKG